MIFLRVFGIFSLISSIYCQQSIFDFGLTKNPKEEARFSNYGVNFQSQIIGSRQGNIPAAPQPNGNAPKLLGLACTDNMGCAGLNHAECTRNTCQCSQGFVALSDIACIPVTNFLGGRCVITAQCSALDPFAVCYEDTCICEPFFHVATTGRATTAGGHPTGIINDGAIIQSSNAAQTTQSCALKRKLGETCQANNQCSAKVWRSMCNSNNVCECQTGYAAVGNQQCVPAATELGQPCSSDTMCHLIANSICLNGQCQCSIQPNFIPFSTIPALARGSDTVFNGGLQPPAPGASGRRKRQAGNRCVPTRVLNEVCETNGQCAARTRNSQCTQGRCQCIANFVPRDQANINECLRTISTLGANTDCTISSQCTVTGAVCNQTLHQCACGTNFCQDGTLNSCLAKLNVSATCTNSCQCADRNATCTSGSCTCPTGTTLNAATGYCESVILRFSRTAFVLGGQFCCFDQPQQREILQLGIDPVSTETSFTISISDSSGLLSVDSTTGRILLASGSAITTATMTFSATVVSNTDSSVMDVVPVTLLTDTCCATAPSLTTSMLTVFLKDSALGVANVGCNGNGQAQAANNAANLIDFATGLINGGAGGTLDIFMNPCEFDGYPTVTSVTLATSTDCTLSGTTLTYGAAVELTNADLVTCTLTLGSVTGCNAMTLSSVSLTVVLSGSQCSG